MSVDKRISNLGRWFNAVNKRDLDKLDLLADEIFTPDFVEHVPDIQDLEPGLVGLKKGMREIMGRNPDVSVDVDDILVDGDKIITRLTAKGNDQTTGKPIDLVILAIDRFVEDKIAEEWEIVVEGKW